MIVQSDGTNHGFEFDNSEAHPDARPQSRPVVWNFTVVGSGDRDESGVEFAEGTGAELRNGIVMGYSASEAIDADDPDQRAALDAGDVTAASVLFANNATDVALGESTWDPTAPELGNRFGVVGNVLVDPQNVAAPNFAPAGDVLLEGRVPTGLPATPDFDGTADYLGAIDLGGPDWTAGWTVFEPFPDPA
ncbi:MAG: hypothetical protein AAF447_10840 [Myxococcota bacterium]